MNEYACGKCGWRVTARSLEGILAAAKHHEQTGCIPKKEEDDERREADQG